MALTRSLADFADEVGQAEAGPVHVRGGATKWLVGGAPAPDAREVRAPSGLVAYQPAEMTVHVGAGTTLEELHAALAAHRQTSALEGAAGATVGGALAVGHNGSRVLRHGPLRDALLQARYVSAEGRIITAGGPTVKNVTGFDLCRLLVGSLGTLGLLGDVILRTRPAPETARWLRGPADPFTMLDRLYRPAAVLWDGETTWVHLEGYADDVRAQAALCRADGLTDHTGPPTYPSSRCVGPPADVATFSARHPEAGEFVAEVGVGVVHATRRVERPAPHAGLLTLHAHMRARFDPTRRLNPGRDPLAV